MVTAESTNVLSCRDAGVPHQTYVSAEGAREELMRRAPLRAEIESWWKSLNLPDLPFAVGSEPIAVFTRHVATARYEDLAFRGLATRHGFRPLWAELLDDKFVSGSRFKLSLLKRHVCRGKGRAGGWRLGREDFPSEASRWDGRTLREIVSETGQTLTEYHHALQDRFLPGAERVDMSAWLYAFGRNAGGYYLASLSLFLSHTVLFEDYHGGESGVALDRFTSEVFEPAREEIIRRFGAAPLIVRMPWAEGFNFYPGDDHWATHGILPPECLRHFSLL